MSEPHVSDDAQSAFRVVIAVIATILVLGMALLVAVVLLYREGPGRHLPFTEGSPTPASSHPSVS